MKGKTREILESVFGESANTLAAYYAPTLRPPAIDMQDLGEQPRKVKAIGKYQPLAVPAPASFPFASEAAERIWAIASTLIPQLKLAGPDEIFRIAMEQANSAVNELTPEDVKMLQLAIHYAQNGPPPTNVRVGGAPGGPMRGKDRMSQ